MKSEYAKICNAASVVPGIRLDGSRYIVARPFSNPAEIQTG